MRATQHVGGLYLTVADSLAPLPSNNNHNNNNQLAAIFFKIVVKGTLRSQNIASQTSV